MLNLDATPSYLHVCELILELILLHRSKLILNSKLTFGLIYGVLLIG